VSAAVLSGLEELSASLEVSLSDVLNLVTQQPTLLLAKVCKPPLLLLLLMLHLGQLGLCHSDPPLCHRLQSLKA
jgi:hypothetical protein